MTAARRLVVAALTCMLAVGVAFGHYHFLHYTSRTGPFAPVPEKFDLNALPDRILHYFVSNQGPEQIAPGDSFASLLSQVRSAADAWNRAENSELRLAFGGLFTPGAPPSTPAVEVLFDELPPGLLAMAGPVTRADMIVSEDSAFVPITRSVLILPLDLSQRPSFTDSFFLTIVHEMGHALGLQHTQTSSVMSTQVTRAATRANPLAQDDIAGLSALYPVASFGDRTGSISGRVTLGGAGVHLASVVALSPGGAAVSALADPDGFYHIRGLPPGQYYVYAHSLPPSLQPELGPDDIVLPRGPDGLPFPAGPLFDTQFYPGTKDLRQAHAVSVQPSARLEGFDFSVNARGPLELYGVTTYSFPGQVAVKPAFVSLYGPRNFLVASGIGLTTDNAPSPGLHAQVIGGSALVPEGGMTAYPAAPSFLQLDFYFNPFSSPGPRHLLFSRNEDLYILPAGVTLVQQQPPSIHSVTTGFDGSGRQVALVAGTRLSGRTRVLFDGLQGTVEPVDESTLMVTPPPGSPGHRAIVTALNPDGQHSLFLDALAPPSFVYDSGEAPASAAWVSPQALPAGSEAMIEVIGAGTNFIQGQTVVGFGTSDIVVRRVWVLSPTHLVANVHVAPSAPLITAPLTVVTGFEILTQPLAMQVHQADPSALVVNPRLVNPATGRQSIYAGGQALVNVSGLPPFADPFDVSVTVNDLPAGVLSIENSEILFQVPGDLGTGPAVLRLRVGDRHAAPVIVAIDPPPPVITSVSIAFEIPVTSDRPAEPGELVVLTVTGLADPDIADAPQRVRTYAGGVEHEALQVSQSPDDPSIHLVAFALSATVAAGDFVPITVAIDERVSQPFYIPIRPSP